MSKNQMHGLSNHRLFFIFKGMKERCLCETNKSYKNYGARGITICNEWRSDFMSFYNWDMANGYERGLTIDRKDNDGNYEPSNCRWINRNVQARNTRVLMSTNTSGYRGCYFHKKTKKWASSIGIYGKSKHLGYFKTALDAANCYNKYVIDNNLEHTLNKIN